ncbi:MAG: hypothetical protein PWQ59_2320 [Thermoanaerobacterium sp.]|jgi:hypothetical protein|uniref:Dihydropteroate synthase n=1 Tax=Thermoanaerobacterium butyriciformans TaxID=1702242 RepID=A0ABS4NEG7_9THEO|nr:MULTISPECIES: hypothetical protein [Thermoanaerobacterium]MDI3478795.1 hypothetical protein [Thermoanaerobacterium sp.]WHE07472.1 hypothetical protein PGH24_01535 [Thermoanaerobacterium thermosaccharolyticum]MBP2072058.1 hypothetical protein [Thermoanaerobacterium butyriciformans]MDK2805756.1 hypothetical protein [Thermoanaerobacterium sp.]MDN5316408.1 hypothetical protein [Thermoanaerobacterium sp.]
MKSEILKIDNLSEAKNELKKLNIEDVSVAIMASKAVFCVIKLKDVHPAAANIIKQEMLALGGEAAVERGCINMSIEKSQVVIMGTLKQYLKLLSKLKMQKGYFELDIVIKEISEKIEPLLN